LSYRHRLKFELELELELVKLEDLELIVPAIESARSAANERNLTVVQTMFSAQ
jgi:hypothetical protein